jgi:phenylalanyl-tRNA synthetase beta chain
VWLLEARLPLGRPAAAYLAALPDQPASERDLALLVPRGTAASEVLETLRGAAGPLLETAWPFDLYEGKGIPEGTRSVAFRLRFRAPDRTLTDAETDGAVAAVLAALEERLGVRRR